MSKVAGFIIGAIEVGIGIATGNVALIVQGGMTIAAQAIVDLTAPKTPAREASEMTIKLGETARAMQVGETYTPGSLVDGFNYGGKYGTDWEVLIIRLADHQCHSLTGFYVNDEWNPYTGDGLYPRYDDQLKVFFRANTTIDPLPAIVLDNGPGWTAADIGQSGCDVIVAYKADKEKDKHPGWPGGRPHFGWVLKGKLCYDLRKDDTVTGGAGSHRWTDPSTWEWSENAIVCWSNYERGVYADDDVTDPTKLLVGRGLTADELPPDDLVIAAANLCDEMAGEAFPYASKPGLVDLIASFLTPSRSTLVTMGGAGLGVIQTWDLATRSRTRNNAPSISSSGYDFAPDSETTFYGFGGGGLCHFDVNGTATLLTTIFDLTATGVQYEGGQILVLPNGGTSFGYYDGIRVAARAVGFIVTHFFTDANDGAWWGIGPVGSGGQIGIFKGLAGAVTLITTGFNSACAAIDRGDGTLFVMQQNGKAFLINKATLAIVHTSTAAGSAQGGYDLRRDFKAARASDGFIWLRFDQWSLATGELLRTINPLLFKSEPSYYTIFDPINDAVLSSGGDGIATWRLLDRHGGYRVAGPIYSNQPFLDVEHMFEAATGGSILTREGSVFIEPGQAKSVVATFTDADLVAGSKASWNQGFLSESSSEWLNTVVATYVEPDQKWNSHSAPPVRASADIIADGQPRESQVSLRLVRYQPQALRIAEIARRKGRLWGRGSVTLPRRFCRLEDGDWVQWQSDRFFAGGTKTLRISAYRVSEKWQNTVTLEEIAASVFAADGVFEQDQSEPVMSPRPPGVGAPGDGNWALAAVTLDSPGASVPALEITGSAADDDYAEAIIFEYWKDDGVGDPVGEPDSVAWISAGPESPDSAKIDITSIAGGATYYAAVSYVVDGITGDRLVLGPVTVDDYLISPLIMLEDDLTPLVLEDGAGLFRLG